MIEYDADHPTACVRWAERQLGPNIAFSRNARAIGARRDGRLVGVVVYDRFMDASCEISFISDGRKRWLSRTALHHTFAYPFRQLRLHRVTAITGSNNLPAKNLVEFAGFTLESRMAGALRDGDLLVYRLFADDCRWL